MFYCGCLGSEHQVPLQWVSRNFLSNCMSSFPLSACSSLQQQLKWHSCEEPISGEIYLERIACWSSRLHLEFAHKCAKRFKGKKLLVCENTARTEPPGCVHLEVCLKMGQTTGTEWSFSLCRSLKEMGTCFWGTGCGAGPLLNCSEKCQGFGDRLGPFLCWGDSRLPYRQHLLGVCAPQNGARAVLWFGTASDAQLHPAITGFAALSKRCLKNIKAINTALSIICLNFDKCFPYKCHHSSSLLKA